MLTEVPWILLHPIQDSTLEKEKKIPYELVRDFLFKVR